MAHKFFLGRNLHIFLTIFPNQHVGIFFQWMNFCCRLVMHWDVKMMMILGVFIWRRRVFVLLREFCNKIGNFSFINYRRKKHYLTYEHSLPAMAWIFPSSMLQLWVHNSLKTRTKSNFLSCSLSLFCFSTFVLLLKSFKFQ